MSNGLFCAVCTRDCQGLSEAVLKLTRVAVLADASSSANALLIGQTETAGQTLGVANTPAPAIVAEPGSNTFRAAIWKFNSGRRREDGARGAVRPEIGKPRARAVEPALDRSDRTAADRRGAIY